MVHIGKLQGRMKPKKRQKLCPSCEGEVDLDVIFCPFCGTDLLEEKEFTPPPSTTQNPSYKDSLEQEIEETNQKQEEKWKLSFWPFFCLNLGVWLFLIALFILFFSQGEALWLRINAKLWLYFLLGSLPLLAIGGKKFFGEPKKNSFPGEFKEL